jgi:ribosomal protein S18 acetylase RimI-like enzyme
MPWQIQKLLAPYANTFRRLRLEALQKYRQAFGSTYEIEAAKPPEYFVEMLDKTSVFGGFERDELVGIIGYCQRLGQKDNHKGYIWGMYVKPHLQGGGLAAALLDSIIELAKTQAELVQLTVVTPNPRAVRFYERAGFRPYGLEEHALKDGERYFHELHMVRFL